MPVNSLSRTSSAIHQTTCPLSCGAVFGWSMSLFTVHYSVDQCQRQHCIQMEWSVVTEAWQVNLVARKKLTGLICTHTQLSLLPLLFEDLLCFLANPKPKLLSFYWFFAMLLNTMVAMLAALHFQQLCNFFEFPSFPRQRFVHLDVQRATHLERFLCNFSNLCPPWTCCELQTERGVFRLSQSVSQKMTLSQLSKRWQV